jgi:hypothetical protein
MEEPGTEGGMGESVHDPVESLAHAMAIVELMSAAEKAHAQILDRAARESRETALRKLTPFARVIAASHPAVPLWLNLTLHAHETFGGGNPGTLLGGPDVPDDVTVKIFSFSIDTEPRPVKPAELDRHKGFTSATRDMEWTEAIPFPSSLASGGSSRSPH